MTDQSYPRPDELEGRLDDLMEGGAEPPDTAGGESVSTSPNEAEAEHEPLAVADAEHDQEPGEQVGGGGN